MSFGEGRGRQAGPGSVPAPGSRALLPDAGSSLSSRQSGEVAGRQMHFPCQSLLGPGPRLSARCRSLLRGTRVTADKEKGCSRRGEPGSLPDLGHTSISLRPFLLGDQDVPGSFPAPGDSPEGYVLSQYLCR